MELFDFKFSSCYKLNGNSHKNEWIFPFLWLNYDKKYGRELKVKIQSIYKVATIRSSHQSCSMKKDVLRNFAKSAGKHLCQSLILNKVVGVSPFFNCLISFQPQACNFIKKETLAQVFSCEFCEISKNTFFTEHLCTTASEYLKSLKTRNC